MDEGCSVCLCVHMGSCMYVCVNTFRLCSLICLCKSRVGLVITATLCEPKCTVLVQLCSQSVD